MAGQDTQQAGTQADRESRASQPLNRRRALRVLSALAAATASAAVLSASQPEAGNADGLEGPTFFNASIATDVAVFGNNSAGGNAIVATNNSTSYAAIAGENSGSSVGVYGSSNGGQAVYGTSSGPISTGVYGTADLYGVWGVGGTYGVYGHGSTAGILGASSNDEGAIGVWGQTVTSGAGGNAGVLGSNGASGPGVSGISGRGIGVSGTTNSGAGGSPAVQGVNSGAGPGVVGFSGTGTGVGGGTGTGIGFAGIASSTGIGVAGQSTSGYAGFFYGGAGVLVNGPFTVMGGPKNAAVRGNDGHLHRLYCLESPESWFEDFGSSQLTNGGTTVHLEPGFAGVVKTDAYHVFLTPRGDSKGLYVSNVTPTGFAVHEQQGGTSSITFDYRVVAKRKDIEGKRLEHVDEPPAIDLPKLAEPPAMPSAPPTSPKPPAPTPPGHGR
jgi:hypothetical protein